MASPLQKPCEKQRDSRGRPIFLKIAMCLGQNIDKKPGQIQNKDFF